MNTPQKISQLLYRHLSGTISEAETEELIAWVNASPDRQLFFREVNDNEELAETISLLHPERWNQVDAEINQKIQEGIKKLEQEEQLQAIPVHRVHFLKRAWWKYAAAIIIIAGAGAYLWKVQQNEKPSLTKTNPVPVQNDVAPGGNRATLTLADGSTINLDSASNGVIAKEGNTSITKKNGSIEYDSRLTTDDSRLTYNTMATPRGGQYQLTLPDGSKVWLNAESSITYPTVFTGNERNVFITGEAYFEVAKDKVKPFIVKTHIDEISVIGTHFNINAYADESVVKTSLLEGSVKIVDKILKPGQAYIDGKVITTNTEQDVAWKNGVFNFNNTNIEVAMRQLSRWYDVNIQYDGKIPPGEFGGEIGRNLNLSQVLKILDGVVARLRLEGRTLHVSAL